jgi:serine/threonine-protein kinase RsbW
MKHELKLYCDTHQLVELRSFLKDFLGRTTLSDIDQHQVTLAVEEVCANLIIHSHDCNPKEYIEIQLKQKEDGLVFEITDSGLGFNILEYKEPELSHVIKAKRKGGLGIMLVKKIMDKIEFETSGKENTCRLYKKLNSK